MEYKTNYQGSESRPKMIFVGFLPSISSITNEQMLRIDSGELGD